jgi:hypothetical protein
MLTACAGSTEDINAKISGVELNFFDFIEFRKYRYCAG